MRTYLTLFFLTLSTYSVWAQDPGMQAAQLGAQQAQMAAQQASDQAMRDSQQATQNAQQVAQNAQPASQTWECSRCYAETPKFSVKPGSYPAPVTVKIRDATRGAVIYYTTDGWTPTGASTRYIGPITIESTTLLQAIAISPYGGRSRIVTAIYTLNGRPTASVVRPPGAVPITESAPSADGKFLLARGTPVPLIFGSDVSSKSADVGDKVTLTLAEDLKAGNVVVLKKGALANATITEVERTATLGTPGEVFFQAESHVAGATVIKLRGSAAKEGQYKAGKAFGLMFVPVVPAGLFVHGKDAEIKQGTLFTAFVDADALLPPAN